MSDNEFTLKGFVGKNVYVKRDPNGKWMMTDFLLGVWKGKNKQNGKNEYYNIPIKYWGKQTVESGEEIVVRGSIIMVQNRQTKKYEPQLSVDEKGISFSNKTTQMVQSQEYEAPEGDDSFFDQANEVMDNTSGIPF